MVDGENNLDITLAVPIEEEGESVAIASQPSPGGEVKMRPFWGRGVWLPPEGERCKGRLVNRRTRGAGELRKGLQRLLSFAA